jgi:tetrapyrrole methylase family protein/MazG family protein
VKRVKKTTYPPVPTRELARFVHIVRRLRAECPWDREQTHQSIRHSLIEETFEVVEALDENNLAELKIELGDLLLHIVMHATMAEQAKEFTLRNVLAEITGKLIRRHPHVFGKKRTLSTSEVKQNWERLKMNEGRTSLLDGIPKAMPALQRALRVQERAAKVGFDWKHERDVWAKVREEGEELRRAVKGNTRKKKEEEFGDYLFALVNYARFIGVEPESALRGTVEKFTRRFQYIERELKRRKKDIHASTLEEMDTLWNKAKRRGI